METTPIQPRKTSLKQLFIKVVLAISLAVGAFCVYAIYRMNQAARCMSVEQHFTMGAGQLANEFESVKRGGTNKICDSTCQTAIDNFMWLQQGNGTYKSPDCSDLPVGEPSDYRDPFNRDEKAYAFGHPTGRDGKIYLSWDAPDTGIDDPLNCRVALEFNLESHPECGWGGPIRAVIGPE